MKQMTLIGLCLTVVMVSATLVNAPAKAGVEPFYTSYLSNVAVQGYDPVAYFTQGKPIEGSKSHTTTYKGAEFRFSSQENLKTFQADPDKYAPQYGGYCAWAVSQGYTAKGNANNWSIIDGKLYLNYSDGVQKTWESDIPGFIKNADKNWPNLLK